MNKLDNLLQTKSVLLLDGAMGTMMMEAGLEQGDPPEEWNASHPDRVYDIHQAYIDAGSRIILTNSFGGTSYRLTLHGLQARAYELNRLAAEIARRAADSAPHTVLVAGSIGPSGELLEPYGTVTYEDARAAFEEQASGLAAGGVDLFWVETMSDLNEAKAAIEGARLASDIPIAATMTFDTRGHTMMGVSPQQALETLRELPLVAIGANCGNGPGEIEGAIAAMRATHPDVMLIAKSNAGIPQWQGDTIVYDGTPEVMARYAVQVRDLGARLIGACCGSTPEHIRAMSKALFDPVSKSNQG